LIQIKESETYRNWRTRRNQRKLARLKSKIVLLEETLKSSPPKK
jgi:hypothetical protein